VLLARWHCCSTRSWLFIDSGRQVAVLARTRGQCDARCGVVVGRRASEPVFLDWNRKRLRPSSQLAKRQVLVVVVKIGVVVVAPAALTSVKAIRSLRSSMVSSFFDALAV